MVTGGAGFVGFHLCRRLLETTPHRVVILENFIRGAKDEHFLRMLAEFPDRVIVMDEADSFPREPIDVIYHLAALNGTRLFYEMPYELLRNNVLITLRLLDHYQGKAVKILYASSSEVYGDMDLQVPTPETTPVGFRDVFNPRWSYGHSKLFGELALINGARINPQWRYSIFRLHNTYGPRMGFDHVVPDLLRRMAAGEDPLAIKNPDDTRSFCYIDDAVDGMMQLLDCREAEGEIVHLGNPEEITVWQLAETMARMFYDPMKLRRGEKLDAGSAQRRCPDIGKLARLTGFCPKVRLEAGLRLTYESYRPLFRVAAAIS